MPAWRQWDACKGERMCPTPGCARPSMRDRRLCDRCKRRSGMASRRRYASSEKGIAQRRLRAKLRPPRVRWTPKTTRA